MQVEQNQSPFLGMIYDIIEVYRKKISNTQYETLRQIYINDMKKELLLMKDAYESMNGKVSMPDLLSLVQS